nr:MerR family transcriptional regulator [Ruania halotolerans]
MLRAGVKISEAAQASGVSIRSLRFYEDEGLIVPGRCSNSYRDFCPGTIDRVRLIRSLLESGLPVSLIRQLLPYVTEGSTVSAALLRPELRAAIGDYRDRLVDRIGVLTTQRLALDSFLEETRDGVQRS